MSFAKKVILPGVFTALLIGGQLALSGISGIEIVTVLLLTYAYRYGVKQGLLVATSFSVLRCFMFGFIPNVIVLYLIYYNLFAVVFGCLGKLGKNEYDVKTHVIVIVCVIGMTALFTLIDDVLTPLMYGFTPEAMKTYFYASLATMVPQIICAFATVLVLFPALLKVLIVAKC